MKCLNCGKEVIRKEGKREKKFCSDSCRATYHRKQKGPKVRWVGIEEYQKLQKELEEERANRSNPLINAARGRDESGVNEDEVRPDNSAILAQIKAIEAETLPPLRNTPLGKKSWNLEQKKRIEELKKQLQ